MSSPSIGIVQGLLLPKQLAYLLVAGERLGWIFIQGRGGQVDGVPVQTEEGAALAVLGVEGTEVAASSSSLAALH